MSNQSTPLKSRSLTPPGPLSLFILVAQVFGRNESGTIEFNDVVCTNNEAGEHGGCFYNVGTGIVTDETTMEGNVADQGGCICECAGFFSWFD